MVKYLIISIFIADQSLIKMDRTSILNQYKGICSDVLGELTTKLNKSFKSFLMETLILYLVIPGRINFLQLGRYGKSCEQRFRQNFSKDFDWLEFNLSLSDRVLTGDRKAIAIDPSYISKSGKNTPWIGYFWSGAAGQAKRGLEILGVGLIDVDNKDCINLQAVQTPDRQTLESRDANLIGWYLLVLKSMQEKLHRASRHVVADAYFAKNNFVTGLQEMKFDLVSRFRDDAALYYPTLQKPTGKKGRPKLYDGKIDMANLNTTRVQKINIDNGDLYTLIAYSKSFKQMVRLVIWYSKDGKNPKLFFSTNPEMSGKDVIEFYRTRFQIEFCFRDAKGFTGLMQSQARDVAKLSFNFNASLTSVNLAKVLARERGIPFSMASCKTMIHNAYLLERFICVSGIKPNRRLNDKLVKELIEFAASAA
ncbi:Putative transposase, IS4 family [Petrimonas sp. IBARAKI]|nr:Putative transposase, IS4 family [Petrimonas sp. IBARAKI]